MRVSLSLILLALWTLGIKKQVITMGLWFLQQMRMTIALRLLLNSTVMISPIQLVMLTLKLLASEKNCRQMNLRRNIYRVNNCSIIS